VEFQSAGLVIGHTALSFLVGATAYVTFTPEQPSLLRGAVLALLATAYVKTALTDLTEYRCAQALTGFLPMTRTSWRRNLSNAGIVAALWMATCARCCAVLVIPVLPKSSPPTPVQQTTIRRRTSSVASLQKPMEDRRPLADARAADMFSPLWTGPSPHCVIDEPRVTRAEDGSHIEPRLDRMHIGSSGNTSGGVVRTASGIVVEPTWDW
jgi:hypothetical protein